MKEYFTGAKKETKRLELAEQAAIAARQFVEEFHKTLRNDAQTINQKGQIISDLIEGAVPFPVLENKKIYTKALMYQVAVGAEGDSQAYKAKLAEVCHRHLMHNAISSEVVKKHADSLVDMLKQSTNPADQRGFDVAFEVSRLGEKQPDQIVKIQKSAPRERLPVDLSTFGRNATRLAISAAAVVTTVGVTASPAAAAASSSSEMVLNDNGVNDDTYEILLDDILAGDSSVPAAEVVESAPVADIIDANVSNGEIVQTQQVIEETAEVAPQSSAGDLMFDLDAIENEQSSQTESDTPASTEAVPESEDGTQQSIVDSDEELILNQYPDSPAQNTEADVAEQAPVEAPAEAAIDDEVVEEGDIVFDFSESESEVIEQYPDNGDVEFEAPSDEPLIIEMPGADEGGDDSSSDEATAPREDKEDTPRKKKVSVEQRADITEAATDAAFLAHIQDLVNKNPNALDAQTLYALLDKAATERDHSVITREFIMSVLWAESSFNPNAQSPVGALGIAQFMPGTAEGMGLDNPRDPAQAIPASFDYYIEIYSLMEERFPDMSEDDLKNLTLAAYNAGPYHDRIKQGKLPLNDQTQGYVKKINGFIDDAMRSEAAAKKSASDQKPPKPNKVPRGDLASAKKEKDDSKQERERKPLKVTGWGAGAGGNNELVYFNQQDSRWADKPYRFNNSPESFGDIEICGCGPTSLAMSVATMTNKDVNPESMANFFMDEGGPVNRSLCASNWIWGSKSEKFAKAFGVEIQQISATDEAMKKTIDDGGMVIMSQGQGMFTSNGHIMLVTGYANLPNADGGNHKYLVGDSISRSKSNDKTGYSPSTIIGNGSPDTKAGLGGAGGTRGYLKAAWSITPLHTTAPASSEITPVETVDEMAVDTVVETIPGHERGEDFGRDKQHDRREDEANTPQLKEGEKFNIRHDEQVKEELSIDAQPTVPEPEQTLDTEDGSGSTAEEVNDDIDAQIERIKAELKQERARDAKIEQIRQEIKQ